MADHSTATKVNPIALTTLMSVSGQGRDNMAGVEPPREKLAGTFHVHVVVGVDGTPVGAGRNVPPAKWLLAYCKRYFL